MDGWDDDQALADLLRLMFRGKPGARVRDELPAVHAAFAHLPPFRSVPLPTPASVNREAALRASFNRWFDGGEGPASIGITLLPREHVFLERRLTGTQDYLPDALDLPSDDFLELTDRGERWARDQVREQSKRIAAQLLLVDHEALTSALPADDEVPGGRITRRLSTEGLVVRRTELQVVDDWLSDPGSAPALLVTADPGTGKSKLLVQVLDRLERAPAASGAPIVGAVLLRDETDPDPLQLVPFLQQIATTVARVATANLSSTAMVVASQLMTLEPRVAIDQVASLVAQLQGPPLVLVVDALDQIEDAGAEHLLAAIEVLAETARGTSTRLLCTSRRALPLGFRQAGWRIHRIEAEADHNLLELTSAVSSALGSLEREDDRDRATELILQRCSGNWLWATVNARNLAWLGRQGPLPARIELQDGLVGLYRDGIARVQGRLGAERFRREVKPLLGTLAISPETQLRWIELRWITGIDRAQLDELGAVLAPFVVTSADGMVRLIHPDFARWVLSGEIPGLVEGDLHRRAAEGLTAFGQASGWGPITAAYAANGAIEHWTEWFYRDPFHPDGPQHEAQAGSLVSDARWARRVDDLIARLTELAAVAPGIPVGSVDLRTAARSAFLDPRLSGFITAAMFDAEVFSVIPGSALAFAELLEIVIAIPGFVQKVPSTLWEASLAGYWVGSDRRHEVWSLEAIGRDLRRFASLPATDRQTLLAAFGATISTMVDETLQDQSTGALELLRDPEVVALRPEITRLLLPTAVSSFPHVVAELAPELRDLASAPGPLQALALRTLGYSDGLDGPRRERIQRIIDNLEALARIPGAPPPLDRTELLTAHWQLATTVHDASLDVHLDRAIELARDLLAPDADADVSDDDRASARITWANALRTRDRPEDLAGLIAIQRDILRARLQTGDASWSRSALLLGEPVFCWGMGLEDGPARVEALEEAARLATAAAAHESGDHAALILCAEIEAVGSPTWAARWAELLSPPPDQLPPSDTREHLELVTWPDDVLEHAAELNTIWMTGYTQEGDDRLGAEPHARALLEADLDPLTSVLCRMVLADIGLEREDPADQIRQVLEPAWRTARTRLQHLDLLHTWASLREQEEAGWIVTARRELEDHRAAARPASAVPDPEWTEPPEIEQLRTALATGDPGTVAELLRSFGPFAARTDAEREVVIDSHRIWVQVDPERLSPRDTLVRFLIIRASRPGADAAADLDEALAVARGCSPAPPGEGTPPLVHRMLITALQARAELSEEQLQELRAAMDGLIAAEPDEPRHPLLLLRHDLAHGEPGADRVAEGTDAPAMDPADVLDRLAEIGRMPIEDPRKRLEVLHEREAIAHALPGSLARSDAIIEIQREIEAILPSDARVKIALANNLLERVHRRVPSPERDADASEALQLARSATTLAAEPGKERSSALRALSHAYQHAPPVLEEAILDAIACETELLAEEPEGPARARLKAKLARHRFRRTQIPSVASQMIVAGDEALAAAQEAADGLDPGDAAWQEFTDLQREVLWQLATLSALHIDTLVEVCDRLRLHADPEDGSTAYETRSLVRALTLRADLTNDPEAKADDLDRAAGLLRGDLGVDRRPLFTQVHLANVLFRQALVRGDDGSQALELAMDAVASALDPDGTEDFEARSALHPLILNTMLRTGRWPT